MSREILISGKAARELAETIADFCFNAEEERKPILFKTYNCIFGTWWFFFSQGVRTVPDKLARSPASYRARPTQEREKEAEFKDKRKDLKASGIPFGDHP